MKKQIIILGIITLYSYIIPYGFITIDPCSSTQGHDNTIGYILVAAFPVLLGLLLYVLFSHKNNFRFSNLLKWVAVAVGWLAIAFGLWLFAMNGLWTFVEHTGIIIPRISQFSDCYNIIELTDLTWSLSWLMCSIITGLIIYLIIKRKCKKSNHQ